MNKLVAIVGPTAVGKSALALSLAQAFGGEIVSADSRQVYRYLDIGTAKPSLEERALIPHHLIDVVEPDAPFSLAQYMDLAHEAIRDIHSRGRLPFLVGGSGLYVWALLEGWQLPGVPPDPELRQALEDRARHEGGLTLYQELERLDPVAARGIDPRNVRRVVRALEICLGAGRPVSASRGKGPGPYQALILGLTLSRAELYRRIDERVDRMLAQGLVEEVRGLLARGYSPDLPALSGLGYRQISLYLQGTRTLEEAIADFKRASRNFARRQYAWFPLDHPGIRWLEAGESAEREAWSLVVESLKALGSAEPRPATNMGLGKQGTLTK